MNNIELLNVSKYNFSGEKHLYKYNLKHDEGMLIFIARGSGKVMLNKNKYNFLKNTIFLCLGGDTICFKCSRSVDAVIFAIKFTLKDTAVFKNEYNLESGISRLHDSESLRECFERLYLAYIHKSYHNQKFPVALFYNLLFIAEEAKHKTSDVDAVIRELAEDIHKNFIHGEIDVTSYAERLGLSKDRLSVIFKQRYSLPPYKYQLMLKMNEATQMLLHTKLSVAEISKALGFSSALYFSSAYKKQVGKTPSDVRKMGKKSSPD